MSSLPPAFLNDPEALLLEGKEAVKARNLFLARKIARALFESGNTLDEGRLQEIITLFKDNLYPLSPHQNFDAPMREWMLAALLEIASSENLRKKINAFYHPVKFPYADELIRQTVDQKSISDVHARQAVVVCLLTYLRQNVGSCFATAPAILILREKRELFLDDLLELIQTGKLRRVVGGKEYAVPFSPNWGKEHLSPHEENPLLRSWEYTLASFAEAKAEFVGWNLYHSLGVDSEQPNGIGSACIRFLNEKIQEFQKLIEEHQNNYERIYLEVKALESMAARSSSQNEADWKLLEYRGRKAEMDAVLDLRDEAHHKAERLAEIYPSLINVYLELFPDYFQEIYDAGMKIETGVILDDSPAGFRLLFKHGRTNPSAWTFIYNADQFVDSLTQFFTMTERLVAEKDVFKGLEKEMSELVSQIILEIRTPLFLEEAFRRVAKAHGIHLPENIWDNLEKIEKKPWEYTSGGNLANLLFVLYGFENKPLQKEVDAPQDLLIYLVETLKDAPPDQTGPFLEDSARSLLSSSPTHAFLLRPGLEEFKQCWNNSLYTYTWVRDHIFRPRFNFFEVMSLDQRDIERLIDSWMLPESLSHLKAEVLNRLAAPLNAFDIISRASHVIHDPRILDLFSSHLLKSLPLFPSDRLTEKVNRLLSVMGFQYEVALKERKEALLTAQDLREALLESLVAIEKKTAFAFDPYLAAARAMEKEGFSAPRALVFADTNWPNEFFAFHVCLLSGQLELVLCDYTGSFPKPLRQWRRYLENRSPWNFYL